MTLMTPLPLDQQQHDEMLVPHSDLPDGPQPMEEAAPAENKNTVDTPTVDETPSARFTWTIDNFSRFPKKVYSDTFCVGGYKWYVHFCHYTSMSNVNYLCE
ncbi:Ubiquitin carboxyl-terminal hydrolase 13, partial [Mucuna pruriens]